MCDTKIILIILILGVLWTLTQSNSENYESCNDNPSGRMVLTCSARRTIANDKQNKCGHHKPGSDIRKLCLAKLVRHHGLFN